jgi:hypothetical protein
MRYFLLFIALAYGLVTNAATVAERMTELQAATIAARMVGTPDPIWESATVHTVDVEYWYIDDETIRDNIVTMAIRFYNNQGGTEDAYWLRRVPEPLRAPDAVKYLEDRTVSGWGQLSQGQQEAAIEGFCNSVYQAANPGAEDIRRFTVEAVSGDTILVSGDFDTGTTWQNQHWYVHLIDPDGSVAAPYTNIRFERRLNTEEAL